MSFHLRLWAIAGLLAALLLAGCPSKPPSPGTTLVYSGPTEVQLAPGETLAPTGITFLGVQDGHGQFIIDDLKSTRQIGDSIDWDGNPIENVHMSLRFRILWFRNGNARLAGLVRITVDHTNPSVEAPQGKDWAVYQVPVSYHVRVGEPIPGTTLSYAGATDQGAKLGGTNEYPYRKTADSILWRGRLCPDVGLALNLRVVHFSAQSLRVAGIATITLTRDSKEKES
ncbi:MAG: hypothetical protein J7M34_12175 [Anaerolineae bacterium]|nr:hypothetical protein [Anaerolineae bacterium]